MMAYGCCKDCADLEICNKVCMGLTGEDEYSCDEEQQEKGCDQIATEEDCFKLKGAVLSGAGTCIERSGLR